MSYYFVIIGTHDQPLFTHTFGTSKAGHDGQHKFPEETQRLNQFIIHAALDIAEEVQWVSGAMYLRQIDKFYNSYISLFHTGSRAKFLLLHNPDPLSPASAHLYPLSNTFNPPSARAPPLVSSGSTAGLSPAGSSSKSSSSRPLSGSTIRPTSPFSSSSTRGKSTGTSPIAHNPSSPQAEEAIRQFFAEVYEAWVKAVMSPFYVLDGEVRSEVFEGRVRAAGRKYL